MRVFNYRWLYICLVLFASPVYAVDYYWYMSALGSQKFSSPHDAANAFMAYSQSNSTTYTNYRLGSTRWQSDIRWQFCQLRDSVNGGSTNNNCWYDVYRAGDSCPPDHTFNNSDPSRPTCIPPIDPEPDLCADKGGSSFPFTKSNSSADNYVTVVNGYGIPNTEACYGGCAASTTDQKCTIKTSGAYRCSGTAYYTGSKCTTAPNVDFTDQQERPQPETTSEETPCQYVEGPDGVLRCDSEFTTQKEGQYCGEVNGVKTCVDSKPTKNGVNIKTEVKTETKPDGSSTTTKTDTATHTKCTGANQCTSTTTTTKTVIEKDANGKTNSIKGSCTGPACPDKNTNPDGDGDGFGDCITGDCAAEEGGSGEGWYESKDDTYASVLGDFRYRVAALPVVTGITSFLTFNPSGSCPGETINAWVFTIQLDQWCGNQIPWNFIAAIILGVAAIMSFRIAFL